MYFRGSDVLPVPLWIRLACYQIKTETQFSLDPDNKPQLHRLINQSLPKQCAGQTHSNLTAEGSTSRSWRRSFFCAGNKEHVLVITTCVPWQSQHGKVLFCSPKIHFGHIYFTSILFFFLQRYIYVVIIHSEKSKM